MNFDFPFILTSITVIAGIIYLIDAIFWSKTRVISGEKMPLLIDYSRSLFPVLIIVLIIRSFIAQPYRVPTGSLEPTVIPGDLLLVTQYNYGLRLPVTDTKILNTGKPNTGDIVVFHWPVNYNINFIKRTIGTPGDKISYQNNILSINGVEAKQTFISQQTITENGRSWKMNKMLEDLSGVKHYIYVCADRNNCPNPNPVSFKDLVVPKGEYFMMGDNRDNSDDSRNWGFVPKSDLVGKGAIIWMSLGDKFPWVRWNRIGNGFTA